LLRDEDEGKNRYNGTAIISYCSIYTETVTCAPLRHRERSRSVALNQAEVYQKSYGNARFGFPAAPLGGSLTNIFCNLELIVLF
jgi:hypothetical protein